MENINYDKAIDFLIYHNYELENLSKNEQISVVKNIPYIILKSVTAKTISDEIFKCFQNLKILDIAGNPIVELIDSNIQSLSNLNLLIVSSSFSKDNITKIQKMLPNCDVTISQGLKNIRPRKLNPNFSVFKQ